MEHSDLDWVTQFDEAEPRRPRSGALTIALGALFGGGGIAAIALLVAALSRPAEEESGVAPTAPPAAAPTPTATRFETPPPPSVIPSGCGALYSESMVLTLEQIGFELGSEYDGPWLAGSADAELRALLAGSDLACNWTDDTAALLTRVTEVDPERQALAMERLEGLGFTRLTEHGGVRYFVERSEATGPTGESHFFREGVWFATHWLGHGQYGYTADMARTVFD